MTIIIRSPSYSLALSPYTYYGGQYRQWDVDNGDNAININKKNAFTTIINAKDKNIE